MRDEITCIFAHEFEKSGSRRSSGGIGRHAGLKIQWTVRSVWVQVPSRVQNPQHMLRVFFVFPICAIEMSGF